MQKAVLHVWDVLAILIILLSVGCMPKIGVQQKMIVELDIFSGRPNPSWELSSEEITELTRRMSALTNIQQPSIEKGLGYRGFVISNPEMVGGLPVQIRVYRGVLTTAERGLTSYYKDANNIEGWLLEQARKRGYGDIINETIE